MKNSLNKVLLFTDISNNTYRERYRVLMKYSLNKALLFTDISNNTYRESYRALMKYSQVENKDSNMFVGIT